VNAAIQIATTKVMQKNAALTLEKRRANSRAPNARITAPVVATGSAYGDSANAPVASADIVLLALR
jgi:hypothetical protein